MQVLRSLAEIGTEHSSGDLIDMHLGAHASQSDSDAHSCDMGVMMLDLARAAQQRVQADGLAGQVLADDGNCISSTIRLRDQAVRAQVVAQLSFDAGPKACGVPARLGATSLERREKGEEGEREEKKRKSCCWRRWWFRAWNKKATPPAALIVEIRKKSRALAYSLTSRGRPPERSRRTPAREAPMPAHAPMQTKSPAPAE